MQEFSKFFTFYPLFGYSVLGLLLLILGFRKRSRIIVEISQFFLIIPISGMLVYELIAFRDSEAFGVRLISTLSYTLFVILFIIIAKMRVRLRAGFLIWILIFEFLLLGSISGYT